ncbi:hypothetical protein AB3331_02920 [Streptococcus sp. H49]
MLEKVRQTHPSKKIKEAGTFVPASYFLKGTVASACHFIFIDCWELCQLSSDNVLSSIK